MLRNAAARGFLLAAALLAAVPARAFVNCTGGNTLNVPATFPSISAAVTALPATFPGPMCINILDSGVYNEQVTVRNFNTGGSSLTIQAVPGQFPTVSPPIASNAAFQIFNDSVNIQGIGVFVNQTMPFGVLVSSAFVSLSSVNVDGGASVTAAAIAISSWTTVANSSVSATAAHGIWVTGNGNMIVQSTAVITSANRFALFLNASSGNVIAQSWIVNTVSTAAFLTPGSNANDIRQSTMIGGAPVTNLPGGFGLTLEGTSSNTVRGSVVGGGGSGGNNGSGSNKGAGMALYVSGGSSLTVMGSILSGGGGGSGCNLVGQNGNAAGGGDGANNNCASSGGQFGGHGLFLANFTSATITSSLLYGGGGGAGHGGFSGGTGLYAVGGRLFNVVSSTLSGGGGAGYGTISGGGQGGRSNGGGTGGSAGQAGSSLGSGGHGLYIVSGASNTVTQTFLYGGHGGLSGTNADGGHGALLETAANWNVISQSTMTPGSAGGSAIFGNALNIVSSSSNTVTGSYMIALGTAAILTAGANNNTIAFSTAVSNGGSGALSLNASNANTFSQSTFYSNFSTTAYFAANSNGNTISRSTMTGGTKPSTNEGVAGLVLIDSSSNTITESVLGGGKGPGSPGTRPGGHGLYITGGSSNTDRTA